MPARKRANSGAPRRPGRATVYGGRRYRSMLEASVAKSLAERTAGAEYETVEISYTETHLYTPDFVLKCRARSDCWRDRGEGFRCSCGRPLVLVEVKGYFPAEDRRKLIRVRESNPGVDIRLVFSEPFRRIGKIAKRSGNRTRGVLTYASWARRNGFLWAGRDVPDEWLRPQEGKS